MVTMANECSWTRMLESRRVPLIFYDPTSASWQGGSTMGGGTSDAMVELIE